MLSALAYKVAWNVPFLNAWPPGIRQEIYPAPGLLRMKFLLTPGLPEEMVRVGIERDTSPYLELQLR